MMIRYRYKISSILLQVLAMMWLIVCGLPVQAQTTKQELDSLVDGFNMRMAAEINAFEHYADSVREAYQAYLEKATAEFNRYTNKIQKIWGGDSIILDSRYEWVEYSNDFQARSIVNFEQGNARVEVAVDLDASQEEIDEKLTEALYRLMVSRGSTCPYPSQVDQSRPITKNPVLDGLLDLSGYHLDSAAAKGKELRYSATAAKKMPPQPVVRGGELDIPRRTDTSRHSPKDKPLARTKLEKEKGKLADEKQTNEKETIAYQVARQSRKSVTQVTGEDGRKRKVVHIQMPLVHDNLSKSAALYKDIVRKYSERFRIEQPLIFAVIEQESAFNPEAVSSAPAYGLMQLVPTSGGVHAYSFVYGVEKVPTKSYLFDPERNIELGTAYLRILYNMFDRVNDLDCRRLCVIAGYNTGAGNVSRAFIGSTRLSNAYDEINKFSYRQLYRHLTHHLNTAEARNYVKGVTKRREKYIKK